MVQFNFPTIGQSFNMAVIENLCLVGLKNSSKCHRLCFRKFIDFIHHHSNVMATISSLNGEPYESAILTTTSESITIFKGSTKLVKTKVYEMCSCHPVIGLF